jgi:CRP-like cAMP-binding protein
VTPETAQRNRILAHLPAEQFEHIRPHLELVGFAAGEPLVEPGERFEQLYFPVSGMISMVAVLKDGGGIEAATVGYEGMEGINVFLGVSRSWSRLMGQVPGDFLRLPVADFERELPAMPALRAALLRYTAAMLATIGQTAACNRAHEIRQRAARWLLMTDDRMRRGPFTLTQEFLAQMLGVGRPGVSLAARALQQAGAISYSRGHVRVIDRGVLEEQSCECYATVNAEFEAVMG